MKNAQIAVLSCLVAGGCVGTQGPQSTGSVQPAVEVLSPIKLSSADTAAVQAGVRSSLKDPDSAKFGGMVAGKDAKGIVTVCLHVNAKNSYGGYTGMKPMLGVFADRKFVVSAGQVAPMEYQDLATYNACEKQGLAIPAA